jgi:hypothetical protein
MDDGPFVVEWVLKLAVMVSSKHILDGQESLGSGRKGFAKNIVHVADLKMNRDGSADRA